MNHRRIVTTLYRGIIRGGKRWTYLKDELSSVGLPTRMNELRLVMHVNGKTKDIQRWLEDRELVLDMEASDKWIARTLEIHNGDVVLAARSRFNEIPNVQSREAILELLAQNIKDPCCLDELQECIPADTDAAVNNGFIALRLLNYINAFKQTCLDAHDYEEQVQA